MFQADAYKQKYLFGIDDIDFQYHEYADQDDEIVFVAVSIKQRYLVH